MSELKILDKSFGYHIFGYFRLYLAAILMKVPINYLPQSINLHKLY